LSFVSSTVANRSGKPAKNEDARDRSPWRLNAVNSQVTWTMHRPVQPSNEVPSFLDSCIFRLSRRWIFEFPRISHPSACQSRISRLPRIFAPPAVPTMSRRVAPTPASSGCTDGESPGCPKSSLPRLTPADGSPSFLESRTLRRRRPCVSGLPRLLHLRLGR
jgi:hypothetical protein